MEIKGLPGLIKIESPKLTQSKRINCFQHGSDTFTRAAGPKGIIPVPAPGIHATNPLSNIYSPDRLLRAYANQGFLEKTLSETPELQELMSTVGIDKPKVDVRNVTDMIDGHLKTTTEYSLDIAKEMGCNVGELRQLETAAKLHDLGKALIPRDIITSTSRLSDKERMIINTHAEAGKLFLQKTGIDKRVLDLIGGHNTHGSNDKLCQILIAGDITSALKEARSYKTPMPDKQVLHILEEEATHGKFSKEIVGIAEKVLAKKAHI